MPDTVLAAVKIGAKQTELREFPLPEIAEDAGLLKVTAAGVCGSDIPAYFREGREPLILGHENVGIIAKIGRIAAARWGVQEGDRVAIEEYLACGHCEHCRQGEYRHCYLTDHRSNPSALRYGSQPVSFAPSLWGGFAQYLYLPPNAVLHRVPSAVSDHFAAMALPMGNGVQWAVIDGEVGPGKSALIMGPGQQGLACTVAALASGASQVFVSGLAHDEYRLGVAHKLGATATINVEAEDLVSRVRDLTGREGVDSVIDCTNAHGGGLVSTALDALKRKGGNLLMQANGTVDGFPFGVIGAKYVTLRPARGHSYNAVEIGLKQIASGRFPLNL
ncbi:MAG TPA: alcohol dehydrogenase catalytic domain-containing protein, partial [Chloroflexota bacterium]|nr:alcohol dehydrogenase catalytic domain-containing protein [Chloroflexota bacterium]